jgi:heme-degrading monooxygenase HmoA
MSVLMTLRASADPKAVEEYAAQNAEKMQAIIELAEKHGVIAHRFYGSGDDRIMVVDEWPSEDAFNAFFAEADDIREMMGAVGMSGEPEVTFWRDLDTKDAYGWNA